MFSSVCVQILTNRWTVQFYFGWTIHFCLYAYSRVAYQFEVSW